jgi:LysM repeat protein
MQPGAGRHGGTGTRSGRAGLVAGLTAVVMLSAAGYTVTPGETLSGIAQRTGVPVSVLAQANDIDDTNRIYAGHTLTIPGADGAAPAPTRSASSPVGTHVVARGETLGAIAEQYGLSVAQLARANGISDPSTVWAGSRLRIASHAPPAPGGGSGATGTHRIAPGETLTGIAARYGTTVSALASANDLPSSHLIIAGRELEIPAGGGSGWSCPVPGGRFVNDFGVGKPDGRYHEGIDVFASRGTSIAAPVTGTAEHVTGSRAGRQVTLHGSDGYTYIFTHLDAFGAAGRVAAGTSLGTVGTSGNAVGTSPHLHFEMHRDGVVNPYPTLRERC